MRILFSCRHYLPRIGGLQLSVHQLVLRLIERGHEVSLLTTTDDYHEPRFASVGRIVSRFDKEPPLVEDDGFAYTCWRCHEPNRGPRAAIARANPDVVVAHVGGRATFGLTRGVIRASRHLPNALYFRDVTGVEILGKKMQPTAVLTNAQRITDLVRTKGWDAPTIPSIVETDEYITNSTRDVVLFVNPRSQRKGVDIAWTLAAARPDVPFVFLEAWRFTPQVRAELEQRAATLGNVEVRASVRELDRIYADARVLFAPYEDSRPRVVAEAQANGIPVLGARVPGLVEAVGPGGVLVDFDAPGDEWAAALGSLWDDPARYAEVSEAARAHSQRDDMRPDKLAEQFEQEMEQVVREARR